MVDVLRVAVVADEPLDRAALAAALASEPTLALVSVAAPAATLEPVGYEPVGYDPDDPAAIDVLVWDASPPVGAMGDAPVLLLVDEERETPGLGDYAAVRGRIGRTSAAATLVAAVLAVGRGLMVADPALEPVRSARAPDVGRAPGQALGRAIGPGPEPAEHLTPRESEVLELLARGATNRHAAAALDISENTVKFHVASLLSKFGVSSRTELVVRALQAGALRV